MINIFFKKSILVGMLVVLVVAAVPLTPVFAADDLISPPPEVSNEKLEQIWAHELKIYERLGNAFDRSDTFVEKVQGLIDRAAVNGKDVAAVQAALDAFEAAIKEAHPIYESAKGIINSHKGFDENGKVTDAGQARETIREMGEKLKAIKTAMGGTGKALREAIKAFREANRP